MLPFTKSWAALAVAAALRGARRGGAVGRRPRQARHHAHAAGREKAGNAAGTIPAWDGGITHAGRRLQGRAATTPIRSRTTSRSSRSPAPTPTSTRRSSPPAQMRDARRSTRPTRWSCTRRAAAPRLPRAHYKETQGVRRQGEARRRRQRRGRLHRRHPVPDPEGRQRGDLELAAALPRRHLRDALVAGGGHARRRLRAGEVRVRVRLLVRQPLQARGAARGQQDPELPAEHHGARAPGRADPAGARDAWTRPRSRAQAWTYNPGQRRVRLAPNVAYDNPGTAADGLRTNDDFGMFNGATDRYNWKLVGKKEMYIPYNSYKLSDPTLKYADILKPGHINQDLARYELHRVWVVEATLKPGTSHIYSQARLLHRRGQLADPRRSTSTTAAASCGAMPSSTTRTGTTSRRSSARSRSTTTCSRAATSRWACAAKRS